MFNIDQTNMKYVRPDEYERLTAQFTVKHEITSDGFAFPAVDRMIYGNLWVCPIKPTHGDDEWEYGMTPLQLLHDHTELLVQQFVEVILRYRLSHCGRIFNHRLCAIPGVTELCRDIAACQDWEETFESV